MSVLVDIVEVWCDHRGCGAHEVIYTVSNHLRLDELKQKGWKQSGLEEVLTEDEYQYCSKHVNANLGGWRRQAKPIVIDDDNCTDHSASIDTSLFSKPKDGEK